MCGIAGYVGSEVCENVLTEFLEMLEYRGYDSSGIAVKKNNKIVITKGACRIGELKTKIKNKTTNSIGIGHTRWATHGGVEDKNAHPHMSQNGKWCIVHNGIIENHMLLRKQLEENGVNFISDTDSEVIAQLLEYKNVETYKDFIECISLLEGSYAVCAINNKDNKMYLARNKSPLYVAMLEGNIYIASDVVCFVKKCMDYYIVDNGEFGYICGKNILFYDNRSNKIDKNIIINSIKEEFVSKCNFSTFMEKEINEIPNILHNIVQEYETSNYFQKIENIIKKVSSISIIGCGTSYHSGLIGASYIQKKVGIKCNTFIASEFVYSEPIIDENSLYVFISQSGETADTLSAINYVRGKCAGVVVVTNSVHSTMARLADAVLPVFAGVEIAVASTKAYNAQLLVLYLFAEYFSGSLNEKKFSQIIETINEIDINNLYKISDLVNFVEGLDDLFVLGKYRDYFTAMEASLKIREITYINCSALPSGELKHGTLALVSPNTLCFVIITNSSLVEKSVSAIYEIMARGGKVALVTQFDLDVSSKVDYCFKLPNVDEDLVDVISVIPFQIFALKLSMHRGIDPDKPRNLAKSVTVE